MIESKEMLSLPVSAASGLLKIGSDFYTVADDELTLLKIKKDHSFESLSLIKGKLPEDYQERKKLKPDFESLFLHQDKIIAMPSLSRANRVLAASFDLKTQKTQLIDLSELYKKISLVTEELNIEGATIVNDEIWLFQRGNGMSAVSGIFRVNADNFKWKSFQEIKIGQYKEHPLGFTDVFYDGEFIFFLAVVETAKSTYDDGKFLGAVFGKMDLTGKILFTKELKTPHKPEGLWVQDKMMYFVTDADDRTIHSRLYQASLPVQDDSF